MTKFVALISVLTLVTIGFFSASTSAQSGNTDLSNYTTSYVGQTPYKTIGDIFNPILNFFQKIWCFLSRFFTALYLYINGWFQKITGISLNQIFKPIINVIVNLFNFIIDLLKAALRFIARISKFDFSFNL